MTGPSGRNHKLSQLAAERLVVTFDPACSAFILQRVLIVFIKCGIVSPVHSLELHRHQRQGKATNSPITFSTQHFDI